MAKRPAREHWEHLRLKDRIRPGVRVLFVGINPGVRSAMTGHHFAGFSNRFWKLLYDSGLVPERIGCEDDVRLPDWGYGITNLIARPSPGIDDLKPAEYAAARSALARKVKRYKPETLALVGVTLFRALFPELRSAARKRPPYTRTRVLGEQDVTFAGACVFVLPNPSGRNANFSYDEMLEAFRALRTSDRRSPPRNRELLRGRVVRVSVPSRARRA
jgi:double-stranded uracil-DNA glycosylase